MSERTQSGTNDRSTLLTLADERITNLETENADLRGWLKSKDAALRVIARERDREIEAHADALGALRHQVVRQSSGWIPVSERMPANADHVLVMTTIYANPYTAIRCEGYWLLDLANLRFNDGDSHPVTHWMPLPEPPDSRTVADTKQEPTP